MSTFRGELHFSYRGKAARALHSREEPWNEANLVKGEAAASSVRPDSQPSYVFTYILYLGMASARGTAAAVRRSLAFPFSFRGGRIWQVMSCFAKSLLAIWACFVGLVDSDGLSR